jgi:hypothetical protein
MLFWFYLVHYIHCAQGIVFALQMLAPEHQSEALAPYDVGHFSFEFNWGKIPSFYLCFISSWFILYRGAKPNITYSNHHN